MTKLTVVDDLEIRPLPPEPSYSVEATLALPAFWAGAAEARRVTEGEGRGFLVCCQIEDELRRNHTPLADIPAYREWLGPRRPA